MPTSKSAMKRIKTSDKQRLRSKTRRTALKTAENKLKKHLKESETDKAKKQLQEIYQKLDKAVKSGTLHKNKSNRKKSRLSALLNKSA
ncbi:MAG: 30S ribosomal protein S20 [Victivallales bacterium]|nr:30S ribosomal protein S20 [Victivallales bacterium]